MRRVSLLRVAFGPPAAPDRVLLHSLWFKGHNNTVVSEMLERLERLDALLLVFPRSRLLRGPLLRLHRLVRGKVEPWLLRRAACRYRSLLAVNAEQVAAFPGPVLALMEDVLYTPREVELLNRENLSSFVVSRELAGERFRALGVTKPYDVIPLGVSLRDLDRAHRDELRAGNAARGALVVGYHAAFLLSAGDPGAGNPMYAVDHLLELWETVHARVPSAELWLLGKPGRNLERRCAGRTDVVLIGRKPRDTYLAWVAAFDIALYPRNVDSGVQAAKVVDYLGCGVPVVAYDFPVVRDDLGPTGAGVLVRTPEAFADAVVQLAQDPERRRRMAAAAAAAGARHDWDLVARQWTAAIDRRLPR